MYFGTIISCATYVEVIRETIPPNHLRVFLAPVAAIFSVWMRLRGQWSGIL